MDPFFCKARNLPDPAVALVAWSPKIHLPPAGRAEGVREASSSDGRNVEAGVLPSRPLQSSSCRRELALNAAEELQITDDEADDGDAGEDALHAKIW